MADSHDAPSDDPRVGNTLSGKWKLDRLIGIGGMASVYAASHRNGALAAIKVLHPEFARSAESRTRFLREAYIANKAGPGAVRVLDDDVDDDGAPYLVMELLVGEPVDVRAARTGDQLPLREVLWIARETLATLEIAHANGIIHRDLKPGNLFWTRTNTLKMLDFGIARLHTHTGERTAAGVIFGTPGFMAHELALGLSAEVDGRSDIWAVGAIMWNLLTGQDVHPSNGMNELIAAATARAASIATIDEGLPPEVVEIIDRALQFEQADRYPSARAMREAVVRVAGGDPVKAAVMRGPSLTPLGTPPMGVPTQGADEPPAAGFATGMSDDDTLALRGLFELIELAILSRAELESRGEDRWLTAARLGSFRKLEMAYQHAVKALDLAHIGLFWNVLPEGFATKQGLLWIAKDPLPKTPEKMWAEGVRMLGLLPGLALEEFGEIVRLVRGDLAPFVDYATFLQAAQLPHLVYRIDPTKPGMPEHPSISIDSAVSSQGADVPSMLQAFGDSDPALRAALLHRLERVGDGHEASIGLLLPGAGIELAMGLLRVLQTLGTAAARDAIREGEKSAFPIVRIEAMSFVDPTGERVRTEVNALLEAADPRARLDGLALLETYRVGAAAQPLAVRIKSASFDLLPRDERRKALSVLGALLPSRAETIAIGLLQDQRVISAEAHETTRELACEALGVIGSSRDAREALTAAASGRARTSERVWTAAAVALEAFTARIGERS
jgi:hypothetical protein